MQTPVANPTVSPIRDLCTLRAIDAIRCAKLVRDRGVAGPLTGPSANFMKSPPVQFTDDIAREMVEEFILGNGASRSADWTAFFDAQPA